MHRLHLHLRGLLVALAVLVLTAGVVLAARPASIEAPAAAASDGLSRASESSGLTLPVRAEEPALPEVDDDPDELVPEVDEDDEVAAERAQNHGWFVSEAAKAETPDGFDNHGQYVSEIARGDEGKPDAATAAHETGAAAAEAAKTRKTDRASKAR